MSGDALQNALEAFDPTVPIEKAWMPRSSWYTDPAQLVLERRAVFQRSWQPVARVAQLATPGAYRSGCFAGEPWLIVRGLDGVLRGFHNVCRHKGRQVVTGHGVAESLVCGYHAWTYDLNGALHHAPRIAGIQDFDRATMGLVPLRVEVWGPWVFVNADADAAPLVDGVPEIDARLAASAWQQLEFVGARDWSIDCNWKVYVDNYLDGGYHIPHMHPTLDAQLDMNTYRTELFEASSIQSSAPNPGDDDRLAYAPRARIGGHAIYAWLFPNFMVNRYGPWLDSNHVVPVAPDRCRVLYEFYCQPGSGDAAAVEASMAQADVTQREDIEICASVQVGLQSGAYQRGRYAPRVETGEHHFHCLLHRRLSELRGAQQRRPQSPRSAPGT